MNKVTKFLKDCKTFYLATAEKDQPRVRPFGAVTEYGGKVYICTNNTKNCFKQMMENPKVEISGTYGGRWIRLSGEVAADNDIKAKAAMLEDNPSLKNMYSADDGIFEVLYFKKASAAIYSFTDAPEVIEL